MIQKLILSSLVVLGGSLQAGTPMCAASMERATTTQANVLFSGIDSRKDSWYSHLGYMGDLDGDLGTGGLFVRAFGGYGEYDFNTTPAISREGTLFDADAGLGYRFFVDNFVLGAYVGAHYRDREVDGPGFSADEGSEWGGRAVVDATGNIGDFYLNGIVQYSTVEDAIWARLRGGYTIGKLIVGPEYIYLTDSEFDENRVGVFATLQITPVFSITGSVGYADYSFDAGNVSGDDSSLYGGVAVAFTF